MSGELLIVRHASSMRNEGSAPHDMPDCQVPLSDRGRMQAMVMGDMIRDFWRKKKGICEKNVSIWSSPSLRALETSSHIIGSMNDLIARTYEDERLVEWHAFGCGIIESLRPACSRCIGGESWEELHARIMKALLYMKEEVDLRGAPRNLVMVSHVGPIVSAVRILHDRHGGTKCEFPPLNASVRRFKVNEHGRFLDMGYLFEGFMPVHTR